VVLDFVDLPEDDPHRERVFSEHLACLEDDLSFEQLEPRSFSFNSPYGACPDCTGLGTRREVDPELVIPNDELSLRDGAVAPWAGGQSAEYFLRLLVALAETLDFSMDTPWRSLPSRARNAVLHGLDYELHVKYRNRYGRERSYYSGFEGVIPFVHRRHSETDSEWSRERYEGYMREVPCPTCKGARLKPEVLAVTVAGRSIADVCALPISDADEFLRDLELSDREQQIAERVVKEIHARLGFLLDVGLDYLSLDRPGRHAVRRRGAADPAGHADRLRPGRRAVRPGRAVHRAAPARQPPAHRDAHAAPGPRQHPHRGGARRGHHRHRRLGRRHRARCRRARRPGRRVRDRAGPAREPRLPDGGVPLRAPFDPGTADQAPSDEGPRARRPRCARAQPARGRRGVPAGLPGRRHRGQRLGQVHAGQRHPLHRARQQAQRRPAGARSAPDGDGAWSISTRSSTSTRARSAGRRGATPRPTPASSTTCAGCSPRRPRRRCAATCRGGSPSTVKGGRCEACSGDGTSRSR
jgi:hypothetical protein